MTTYSVGQTVWIHLGDPKLTPGEIVKVFNLRNLPGNHSQEDLYVIEITTPIEPVYEVRSADLISSTSAGPINLFKDLTLVQSSRKFLKKVGVQLPVNDYGFDSAGIDDDEVEPTVDQINAAIQRSQEINKHPALNISGKKPANRRRNTRKKQ